jgi:hypothetical protein
MSHALPPATGAPSRRRFVACSAAIVLSPALPGCSRGPGFDRRLQFPSLAAAGDELARLAQAKVLQSDATWNWAQTLNHCATMQAFAGWSGPLRPHFAYGDLDKPAYEHAHAMHIANHLSGFRIGSNAG